MRAVAVACTVAVSCTVLLAACLRSGEERALDDLEVGRAAAAGATLEIPTGIAHIKTLSPGVIDLWAQGPAFDLQLDLDVTAATEWVLTISNGMTDAELTATADGVQIADETGPRPTERRFRITVPGPGAYRLRFAPPDAAVEDTWRFAFMGDIQNAMRDVDDIFRHMSARDDLRFVISAGDLVDEALEKEYDLFLEKLETLDIPFFSTIGNHELWADPHRWRRRFGRYSIHFTFKGVTFSFVDSGNGAIDPVVYGWLDQWLLDARERVHIFGTHYPLIDPVGVRSGSFRSRPEAATLLAKLAAGGVDLTLYGHIHSFYAYENAGIPAYISGGGGAWPEKWDGIGRHYLVVEVTGGTTGAIHDVRVVEID